MHPLALGNVKTIRQLLDQHDELRHIDIIGVGGCQDFAGYERFLNVGAAAVAVGTALGREGVAVFKKIAKYVLKLFSFEILDLQANVVHHSELDTVWFINGLKLTDGQKAVDGIKST